MANQNGSVHIENAMIECSDVMKRNIRWIPLPIRCSRPSLDHISFEAISSSPYRRSLIRKS